MNNKDFLKVCKKLGWRARVVDMNPPILTATMECVTIRVEEGDWRRMYHAQLRLLSMIIAATQKMMEDKGL